MIPVCLTASMLPAPSGRPAHSQAVRIARALPARRAHVRCCAANPPKKGRGRKKADQTPQEDAVEARAEAAEAAEGSVKDAGDQLASAAAGGVVQAETALGRAQGQAAGTASGAEDRAAGAAGQASTATGTGAAADASGAAGDFAQQASAASADTLAGRQKDAAATEDAVKEGAEQVAGAVSEGISSAPTPAGVVQGAADGAADLLRGIGQASGQFSSSAADFQRSADDLAAEVQRSSREQSQQFQAQLNRASEKAQSTAEGLRDGTTYRRGRTLLSDSASLTGMSASAGGKTSRDAVPHLKTRLLAHVAGLDRGFAANKRQTGAVEGAVHDLVGAAGAVDLLSSAAAADSSIFSVTKKGDSPVAGAGPVGPPAAGQTVSPGGKGVTYGGDPPPEAASISASPETPGFAAPGSPAGATGGLPGTGAPGGGAASDAGLAASRSGGSTPLGAPINQPMPTTQPGKPPVTNLSSSSPAATTRGETYPSVPVSETKAALSAPGEGDGIAATGATTTGRSQGDQLGGLWRLVYSSGFACRNTGGARPGVPISVFPAQFGQVYQGIDLTLNRLDNVVELRRPPLPVPPFVPLKALPAEALLTLKHSVAVTGPATVQITFVGTDVNLQGGLGGVLNSVPQFSLPGTDDLPEQLKPPMKSRSASFDVLFLDDDIRVTRGDRNEIRIFVRT